MTDGLTIALSKGRLLEESLPLLARAGILPTEDILNSRKLIFDASPAGVKLLVIRAQDVPTFVQYGAADLGISGKDVLIEHGGEGIYEPLDLKIAACKLMLAGPEGLDLNRERLRVATKYLITTRLYFARQGRQVDIIKLYGSMELAPLVGLADCIVDLVGTGGTLRANGLKPLEHIMDISARVVVNKASMKMKHQAVKSLLDRLAQAVQ